MKLPILIILVAALCSCKTIERRPAPPKPSTAGVSQSVDQARAHNLKTLEGLSAIDAKALIIQEAIRNW